MRLSDDLDDRGGMSLANMAVAAAIVAAAVIGVVLFVNRKPAPAPSGAREGQSGALTDEQEAQSQEEGQGSDAEEKGYTQKVTENFSKDPYISGSSLTSDDLDFWHMYDETASPQEEEEARKKKEEEEKKDDPSTDGKHTRIVGDDGTEEWLSINPYLTKNKYDYSGLVYQYPIMKYYEDSERLSRVGVRVSEEDGEINFGLLKKAGVEFAMIRLGSRAYGSGNLMSDEMFYENVRKAAEAGMDIGVTFYSQAVTVEEAKEEAQRVIEGLEGFEVIYPVVFHMEYVKNDTARVQGLSRDAKTEIAMAFLDAVTEAGYKPMLYGTKEWLLRKVDLTKLIGYDIWVSQEEDTPDYPYKYTMWEYTKRAKMNGMEEPAALSICMIDYASK